MALDDFAPPTPPPIVRRNTNLPAAAATAAAAAEEEDDEQEAMDTGPPPRLTRQHSVMAASPDDEDPRERFRVVPVEKPVFKRPLPPSQATAGQKRAPTESPSRPGPKSRKPVHEVSEDESGEEEAEEEESTDDGGDDDDPNDPAWNKSDDGKSAAQIKRERFAKIRAQKDKEFIEEMKKLDEAEGPDTSARARAKQRLVDNKNSFVAQLKALEEGETNDENLGECIFLFNIFSSILSSLEFLLLFQFLDGQNNFK